MKKDVTLKINSKQYSEKLVPHGDSYERTLELEDSLEIITEGSVYFKSNAIYLSYCESEDMGMQDAKVMLKVKDESLQIIRFGKDNSMDMDMNLEPGVAQVTRYKLPMLPSLDLEVYTNSFENGLNDEGLGNIMVDYRLSMDDVFSRRNVLEVEVFQ